MLWVRIVTKPDSPSRVRLKHPKTEEGKEDRTRFHDAAKEERYGWPSGGVYRAALQSPMNVLAWNYWGLGSPPAVWMLTEEVKAKKPILVFLTETKASINKMKGVQFKLELTQGITVPSDGQSGSLANDMERRYKC